MLEYICLKNILKAFIVTRPPKMVVGELTISFLDAPDESIAVFENEKGVTVYKKLNKKRCKIPLSFLIGEIKVSVILINEKTSTEKFICESFIAKELNGALFVYPNWSDSQMQIIEILKEVNELKGKMKDSDKKYEDLDKKVEKILEGYDFD